MFNPVRLDVLCTTPGPFTLPSLPSLILAYNLTLGFRCSHYFPNIQALAVKVIIVQHAVVFALWRHLLKLRLAGLTKHCGTVNSIAGLQTHRRAGRRRRRYYLTLKGACMQNKSKSLE